MYYEIAPMKIVRASSSVFTYASSYTLQPGALVTIPVGKQTLIGVVIKETKKPPFETKPVTEVLNLPPLPTELLSTALWMSAYYATHLATVLQTILPRGLTKKRRDRSTKTTTHPERNRTHFLLNSTQQTAVNSIKRASPGTIILHGITGSGKTAVYKTIAHEMINSGKACIILIPEIALTSQLLAEFQYEFSDIILAHSKQTEAQRHIAWLTALTSNKPLIAIGPRSALFLPIAHIGAIIIDEAHEPSFKQDQSPRYSALRVASVLGKFHDAKIIQGSATPLVSEYYLAQQAKRPIVEMNTLARADAMPASIQLIDMTKKQNFIQHRFFSDAMIKQLTETLKSGEQSLVFHNRRGSASTTLCTECGWSALCPRCFVPYTLHADRHELRCAICNETTRVPTSCPECTSTDIIHKGIGTKLIETELKKLFPTARIARFDSDTTDIETVDRRYQELYDGTIDIIIGTQVIAKGLDLPHLRMVGVVQADAGLSLPDFVASERTFQLIAQAIGRVGRASHQTHVVVQSYQLEASAVRYGLNQDFHGFYRETISERKQSNFPPYCHLLRLICIYKTEAATTRNARAYANQLRKDFPDVTLFGPTPAFYERQRDTYRWQIIVKSPQRARLLDILETIPATHWQYDIDPASLL